MPHAVLANVLWAVDSLGEVALLVVLVRKKRWRHFPAFTALIASPLLVSPLLLLLAKEGAPAWYARAYWTFYCVNFLLQIAVIVEVARVVLRPTGTWVRDGRKQFILWGIAGILSALALVYLVTPPAATLLGDLELRIDLFSSLITCELFIAMSMASNKLGLGWKNHVMAIGQGLMVWAILAVITDSLHSYYGDRHFYGVLEYLKSAADLGALGYWCVRFWQEEPARQPISPELLKYILALHHRVNYDLGEAGQ